MKILMNAEAFGFGPSAAIAAIFPKIKDYEFITQIDYLGNGHSLDLQRKLPYNQIIDSPNKEHFDSVIKNYDVFITSLDFERASWAQEAGIPTIIYDTLLWYWRKIPSSLLNCHTYITQDFYGVDERIKSLNLQNTVLVPPLIKERAFIEEVEKDIILVNFGGLENPHWGAEITFSYITNMLDVILPILKNQNKEIKIVCSRKHIERFIEQYGEPVYKGYKIENCSYDQMQTYLQRTALLLATPGLGNIYECANYKIPSIFLPPANDSQGQQLYILKERELIGYSIDWENLVDISINYFDTQLIVLGMIENSINCLSELDKSDVKLVGTDINIEQLVQQTVEFNGNQKLQELIKKFGINGLDLVGNAIIESLEKIRIDKLK